MTKKNIMLDRTATQGRCSMKAYINSQVAGGSGAFSDPRIFLAMPLDRRLCILPELGSKNCQVQQQSDGPTYLVIGPNAADDSLRRASDRFGIPMADLVNFRDSSHELAPPASLHPFPQPRQQILRLAKGAL